MLAGGGGSYAGHDNRVQLVADQAVNTGFRHHAGDRRMTSSADRSSSSRSSSSLVPGCRRRDVMLVTWFACASAAAARVFPTRVN